MTRILKIQTDTFDQVNTFQVNVGKRHPSTCYLFWASDENKYYAMSKGTCLKSTYTESDIAERERFENEIAVKNGDVVEIDGKHYEITVQGDFSDAAYFTGIK